MQGGIEVTFHGVRGSTPCEGPQYARYGGHSSCVSLEAPGEPPIVFDMGTGLRPFGEAILERRRTAADAPPPFSAQVLLTHLHWDHVQGLPFFAPLHRPETRIDVYGPRQDEAPLAEVFAGLMRPPYFPIRPEGLPASLAFHDVGADHFPVGSAKVRSAWVRHVGPTLGFRVEWNGVTVVYISDHGPGCGAHVRDDDVPDETLDLCDGADLLIHDAQHTVEEWEPKRHWGHCTVDYAIHVAREAGVRRLALYHHDPSHDDDEIDHILRDARDAADRAGVPEVLAAREGLVVPLAAGGAR